MTKAALEAKSDALGLVALGSRIMKLAQGKAHHDSGAKRRRLAARYHELVRSYRRMWREYQSIVGAVEGMRQSALVATDSPTPVIRRQGKRSIEARKDSKSVLAWAIGQRVRAAREGKNWRQEDLARESGIARANVARLETGRVMPKLPTLERAAKALGLRIDSLLKSPDAALDQENDFLAEAGIGEWNEKLKAEDAAP
ncbi:MAG: helix-turn-helix transcriptional regulator [Elusimicrobia bacterium]|nr:helix-turn-helix transcriptional regulator [Elusimicrobiota bacterium]